MTARTWLALLSLPIAAAAAAQTVPDGSFEEGGAAPAGWQLEGDGSWERGPDGRFVSVRGTGDDITYWRSTDAELLPNTLYRLTFRLRGDGTGGTAISGPSFCNRDFRQPAEWEERGFVFVTPGPEGLADAFLRFGQWHVTGTVSFDDVRIEPTQAVHRRSGDIVLGEGERLDGAQYSFRSALSSTGANYSRPLHSFTTGFNSNRFTFGDEQQVTYRHELPGARFASAAVSVNCNYHTGGTGIVEVSADGEAWQELARFDAVTGVRADVPAGLLPAEALLVRIRADGPLAGAVDAGAGSFQVSNYEFTAELDADLGELEGGTLFPRVTRQTDDVKVELLSVPGPGGADPTLRLAVTNEGQAPRELTARVTVRSEDGKAQAASQTLTPAAGERQESAVDCVLRRAGLNTITVEVLDDGVSLYAAMVERNVAALHEAGYGYRLVSGGPAELWWCEGTHKVSRTRALPLESRAVVELAAARNEYEPVQVVVRPDRELANVRVEVADLEGEDGTLDAAEITVRRVEYVNVTHPTDAGGARGWWPDPLPEFEEGRSLAADVNHTLWLTVHVPADQPAGTYEGELTIRADGWRQSVPLRLKVWGFELPKSPGLQSGFGLSHGSIRRYHNLETTDELRQVLDLYLQDFAAHRIAPYDPAPLDRPQVTFGAGGWQGGEYSTEEPRSGEHCLKVVDDSDARSIVAQAADLMPIDTSAEHVLSWWARTAVADQPYLVTVQQYDADRQWITGNNVDVPRTGTGEWQREEFRIPVDRWNERTGYVNVSLRPAPYSDEGDATGTAWFDDVDLSPVDGGGNLLREPGFEFDPGDLDVSIDFAAFDRECERYLDELGLNSIMVGLQGMPGGTFHARSSGRIGAFAQGSPEYGELMAKQGQLVVDHLQEKGWLEKAYIYWFDEPDPKDYAFVVDGMELIKRSAPGLTRFMTEQPEDALAGHVDLWCPVVSGVTPEAIAERKAEGERFWWYLCTGPKHPYIGLFVDRPATDLRAWAWLSRKWGIEGQLVWSANYWNSTAAFPPPDMQNPWTDPMGYVSGYSYGPGEIGYWGNGDGRFLYPPNRDVSNDTAKYLTGPVPSVRWEMLREGMEDYDYFALLDGLIAKGEEAGVDADVLARARALAEVPDAVIADDKTYSKDPQPIYEHRRQVAEAIEELTRLTTEE